MVKITINQAFTFIISIPESANTDTVTYVIYKANGTTFASGSMTYVAGIQWKVAFTPTSFDALALEINDSTLDVKHSESFMIIGTVEASPAEETDFTYDTTTNIGKLRVLINDTVASSVILTDTKLNVILSLKGNDLYLSAGAALLVIAASRALLAKKKQAGNYSEDLTAIAKECRETAKMYLEMAQADPADAVSEQFLTDFAYREQLIGKALRGENE